MGTNFSSRNNCLIDVADKNKDPEGLYARAIQSAKPCIHYTAKHPKLKGKKHILIEYDSAVDTVPLLSMDGMIGAEINELKMYGTEIKNELDQFMDTSRSYVGNVVLLHVDNRWKSSCCSDHEIRQRSGNTFCCWYLRATQLQYPSGQRMLGSQYALHYLQIMDAETLFITFRLTLLSDFKSNDNNKNVKYHDFMMSPDSNYLLCFGQGCNFIKLP